ncbi:MAG: hypothetical protein ACRELY_29645 [Polyangiaceae bacterium]
MKRELVVLGVIALAPFAFAACDNPKPLAPFDSGTTVTTTSAVRDAAAASYPMPDRPVPKESPTVGIYAPLEVQQKAITYMAAMAAPHPDDPFVDDDFVKSFADKMKPIVTSMDRGSASEKAKEEKVDVIGGGRRIDLTFALGCEAETPAHAVGSLGIGLNVPHDHGILVVACHDARAQCLQSTRDSTDILCTQAPRHH